MKQNKNYLQALTTGSLYGTVYSFIASQTSVKNALVMFGINIVVVLTIYAIIKIVDK